MIDLNAAPTPAKLLDLKQAADLVCTEFFDVSWRTIEGWSDLPRRIINKKRRVTQAEVRAAAERRIAQADARIRELAIETA
jgi:hypothetical protein